MSAVELSTYLESTSPRLLDVREPWEFEICHVSRSINMPMGGVSQKLDQIDQDVEHVVICHHGVRSLKVIELLQSHGYEKLINLDGGVDAWAQQVDLGMATY